MINNLRFELSFKNIYQLENKLNFCKFNKIRNINIPCKGNIKKEFYNSTISYISKNFQEFNVTYHYSLYHQYSKNREQSYQDFLDFLRNSHSNRNYEILLVSGSNKKKNFDTIDVLNKLNKEKLLKPKLGIFKPAFIAVLWTACAVWLPSVLHDHNYDILLYPQDYLPCTLTIFSASNIIDNKDIVEDRQNNITTIPVVYGETNSIRISLVGLILSSLILGFNPHYLDFPVVNSLLEIQNGAISFLPFVLNATLA